MGMFDNPEKLEDHFQEGEEFVLIAAKMGNLLQTIHGESRPVLLRIRKDGREDWCSIFGQGLAAQVDRMEQGDLPATVRVERVATKSGNRVKVLVPKGQGAPTQDDLPF